MDLSQLPDEVGCWKREKILGAGGFGYVVLWRNKEDNQTIALKQCRWGLDNMMTPKHRNYWKMEVGIMGRLDHPNVVRALHVPTDLDVPATDMPILAMEYCSGGDLRKLLNKPENCCGLNEKCVRLLLRHVSSAVNYLHSERIIHRDLKPENIVIQDTNGSMVFKLIDLGYAKELDQGSLCTSFVGTLQYLAPELIMSQKYSCTVDYWSLGLVTHEVITGLRPFLPDESPAEWIPIIQKKTSSQIRAYLNVDKNLEFSEEIAPHHHICSILKEDIESWLQIMLEYDARKRGRCEEASAFSYLMKILDRKVILVFCVNTCKLLSFPFSDVQTLEDFKHSLELKSGIPANEQEILLPNGTCPSAEKGTSQFLSQSEDEVGAFLFGRNIQPSSAVESPTVIPSGVESMMRNPRTKMKYGDQRSVWLTAVFLSQQESLLVSRLIQAFKASLMHLMNKLSHCRKSTSKMTADMNKVSAKSLFLKSSLEQDLHSYRKQAENGGYTSREMFEGWKSSSENLKKLEVLRNRVGVVERSGSSIEARIVELQKMPYARSRYQGPLEEVHNKILEAYGELKKRSREQRQVQHDNTDIVRLLCLCLQQSRSNVQDILLLIRTIHEIRQESDRCVPQIENILHEIREWDTQMGVWQSKRQTELWKIIDALNHKIRCLEKSSCPSLESLTLSRPNIQKHNSQNSSLPRMKTIVSSLTKSRIEPLTGGSAFLDEESERTFQSFVPFDAGSLSFVEKAVEESSRVLQENENILESFQQMIHTLRRDQGIEKSPETNNVKDS